MSLHDDAVRTLQTWTAPEAAQEHLQERYLDHLAAHPDGVWRSCRPDHVTASTLVVDPNRTAVLLILHRRIGRWLQLGGHCEIGDSSLTAAALREATEESGIPGLRIEQTPVLLSFHEVPCGPVRSAHHLDVQYVAVAPPGAVPAISEESDDIRWFALDELPPDVDDSVRALVSRARATAGRPAGRG